MLLTLQSVYFLKKEMNAKKFHIYIKCILGVQYLFKYDRVSTLDFLYTYFFISLELACKIVYYIVTLISL